jgi:putative FmdB family regulatory protein
MKTASTHAMPIYEYECEVCAHRFEQLVLPAQARSAVDRTCPSCRSDQLQQLPSLFAVDSEATRLTHKNHGRRLAQKDLTEQRHAEMEALTHHHREHEH